MVIFWKALKVLVVLFFWAITLLICGLFLLAVARSQEPDKGANVSFELVFPRACIEKIEPTDSTFVSGPDREHLVLRGKIKVELKNDCENVHVLKGDPPAVTETPKEDPK